MTRYSSLAYKRTYHEAGLGDSVDGSSPFPVEPPRKQQKYDKRSGEADSRPAEKSQRWGRDPSIRLKAAKAEHRRVQRQNERAAGTVCFACRKTGHAAKDCPTSQSAANGGKHAVGICYRCGSTKHTLSRCRNIERADNPLPFATCFVCSGKGHLASSCPKNEGKGVYPNGGCCKLCQETTHLAKNCPLRRKKLDDHVIAVADGPTGADEDDFLAFSRKQAEVEHDIKSEKRQKEKISKISGKHPTMRPSTQPKVVAF